MAVPAVTPSSPPSPQLVGKVFVERYYQILHQSPEIVHKFYLDSSTLSRPNSSGVMTSVTTMERINDLVMSLDSKRYITEINTADSQASYKDGVFILVTGYLTEKEDKVRRRFTQSFFLAPKDKGAYFVLNDVFRYVEENQPQENNQTLAGVSESDASEAPEDLQHDFVPDDKSLDSATPLHNGGLENGDEISSPSENGGSGIEEEVVVEQPIRPSQNATSSASEVKVSVTQVDAPKKSYASIVKVMSTSPAPVYVPTTRLKPPAVNHEKHMVATATTTAPAPQQEASTTNSDNTLERNVSTDVEGYSVYIRNLPMNATPAQVEEEFKKFGTIRPGAVQVRSHKIDRFCFGFVEFESSSSMQAAIKASPVMIGGRQSYVEEKRTTTRVVNGVITNGSSSGGRGRFASGSGGFHNNNFRGRGGYGVNQGYGRSEFSNRYEYPNRGDYSNRGEYASRGRGSAGREGYHARFVQNGNGRMSRRPDSSNQTSVSA